MGQCALLDAAEQAQYLTTIAAIARDAHTCAQCASAVSENSVVAADAGRATCIQHRAYVQHRRAGDEPEQKSWHMQNPGHGSLCFRGRRRATWRGFGEWGR